MACTGPAAPAAIATASVGMRRAAEALGETRLSAAGEGAEEQQHQAPPSSPTARHGIAPAAPSSPLPATARIPSTGTAATARPVAYSGAPRPPRPVMIAPMMARAKAGGSRYGSMTVISASAHWHQSAPVKAANATHQA